MTWPTLIDLLFKALALTGGTSFVRQLWQDHLARRDRLSITTRREHNLYSQKLHLVVRFVPDHRHVGLKAVIWLLIPHEAYLIPWDSQTDPASVEHAVQTLQARNEKVRMIRQKLQPDLDGSFVTTFEVAEFGPDTSTPVATIRVSVQADDGRKLATHTFKVSPID